MPSHLHEALLQLFRYRPELAPALLREACRIDLPKYREAQIDSADLTQVKPVEYHADAVINLLDEKPIMGIIVEIQLGIDERKRYTWPAYATNLRARLECPVSLLVLTHQESVAQWAAREIDLGGENSFRPIVIGPAQVPEITDRLEAKSDPELAVLSVIAHGRDRDSSKSARIARAAQEASLGLDPERMFLYFDLILASLSEAARRELRPMKPAGYEPQSDYFRNLWTEARASGRRELVTRLLTVRFGSLPEEAQTQIAQLGIDELDAVGERLLTANSVGEALGSHWRA